MRKVLLIIIISVFVSCKQSKSQKDIEYEKFSDSLSKAVKKQIETEEIEKDSLKIVNSPVKIISAKIVSTDDSSFKSIGIKYKNTSDKTISAIKFRWKGVNAFGEPADMGSLTKNGEGSGYDDTPLKSGKSRYNTWNLVSHSPKKVTKIIPYEIVFTDGTRWKY